MIPEDWLTIQHVAIFNKENTTIKKIRDIPMI